MAASRAGAGAGAEGGAESKEVKEVKEVKAEPYVLNIVILGTNSHHLKPGTRGILTELALACSISSTQSVHVIDGPGGEPPKVPEAKKHPMLGTYDFSCEYNPETGQIISKKTLKTGMLPATYLGGIVKGTGYKDAIKEALTVCHAMIQANKIPLVFNFYGYSRGADTALRISNALQAKYGTKMVEVNILAIDPVPGVGRRKAKAARMIPSIVREYHGLLMANEMSDFLEPQDKSRVLVQSPANTRVHYSILEGGHSSAIRFYDKSYTEKRDKQDAPYLLWDAVYRFAQRHGTRFLKKEGIPGIFKKSKSGAGKYQYVEFDVPPQLSERQRHLSERQRLKCYTAMAGRMHASPIKRHFMTKIQQKNDYLLHGPYYFADKHHQELFKRTYPAYFDYFFQKNVEKFTKEQILSDIGKIKKDLWMSDSLERVNYPLAEPLGDPRGIFLIVRDQYLEDMPLVTDELSALIHAIRTTTNIMWHTSDYQQELAETIQSEMLKILEGKYLKAHELPITATAFEVYCIKKLKELVYQKVKGLMFKAEEKSSPRELSKEEKLFTVRFSGIIDLGEQEGMQAIQDLSQCVSFLKEELLESDLLVKLFKDTHNQILGYLDRTETVLGEKRQMIVGELAILYGTIQGDEGLRGLLENIRMKRRKQLKADLPMKRIENARDRLLEGTGHHIKDTNIHHILKAFEERKKLPPDKKGGFENMQEILVKNVQDVLRELLANGYGNHGTILHIIINTAILANVQLCERSHRDAEEDELNELLRTLQFELASYKPLKIDAKGEYCLDEFIRKLSVPPLALSLTGVREKRESKEESKSSASAPGAGVAAAASARPSDSKLFSSPVAGAGAGAGAGAVAKAPVPAKKKQS